MMQYIFLIFLCLAVYLEGTLSTLPLVLALIIPYAVLTKKEHLFFYIFLSGIVLDILYGQIVGFTSLYFICSVFCILLYQRKYEIATYPFIAFSTAVVSFFYLLIFVHTYIIGQVIVSVALAEIFFIIFKLFRTHYET